MVQDPIVSAPSGAVPEHVVAFGARGAVATPVDGSNPLPVATIVAAAGVAPLAGSSATAITAGPFAPRLGRAIVLALSGIWTGSAQLLRSTDGGTTRLPLTAGGQAWAIFTGNCNEAVAEESEAGATYYLALAPTSGTIAYRVSQ